MQKFLQKIQVSNIHPNIIGAFWMLCSVLFFLTSYGTVKFAGTALPSIQIVFCRSFFQMLVVLPFMMRVGFKKMKTKNVKNYFFRLTFGITNIILSFYAFTKLDFAISTALTYTRPLFTIVLAAIFFRESVGFKRGIATIIGFIGIIVVLNPGPLGLTTAELAALTSSFFIAVTHIFIQKLSRTENHVAMIMWFGVAAFLVTMYPAIRVWEPMTARMVFVTFIIAASATAAQYSVIRAYQVAKATVVSPLEYLQIPLSALVGFMFFSESPTIRFAIGSLIIISASFYILRQRVGD